MCKNLIKYRTDVVIIAENTKDVGHLSQKTCGFGIDAIFLVVHRPGFVIKRPIFIYGTVSSKITICAIYIYIYICIHT